MKKETTTDVRAVMAKASKAGTLAGLKTNDLNQVFGAMKAQIAQALPKHLTAERIIQMSATLVARNPKIAECSASSIIGAVMEASILGFKPVQALGQCYFIPYGGAIQFQVGYKGWIDLARRSGQIKTIYAHVVREGDQFEYELGLEPKLKHTPKSDIGAKITHTYAVCHYINGGHSFAVLTRDEVERRRMRNPSQKGNPSGAWASDYEEMAKAKAIKALAKYMPLSEEMVQAAIADEAFLDVSQATNDGTGIDPDAVTYDTPFEEVENNPENGQK